MIITTSICANYLPKAMALAESIKRCNPEHTFVLCLVERESLPVAENFAAFDFVVLAKDMGIADFDGFIFRHSVVEASTAVKGYLFEYLYRNFPQETRFVYLDPDVFVYSDLTEVTTLLAEHPILVAPHLLQPGHVEMELSSLKHGVFNLGFLAVNRSPEAVRFIRWWADRLAKYCYDDIAAGIFTDQKWINLAPCFFDVFILKHPGYDYATWTLKTSIIKKQAEMLTVDGHPLRFIHFSGYDSGTIEWAMREWLPQEENAFPELYRCYGVALARYDQHGLSGTPWSYQQYLSGEKIDDRARLILREQPISVNPFSLSNRALLEMKPPETAPAEKLLRKALRVLRDEGLGTFLAKTRRYAVRDRKTPPRRPI